VPAAPAGVPTRSRPGGPAAHFLPLRRRDLVDVLAAEDPHDGADGPGLRSLAELLAAVFHHEFHARLEGLKDAYAPFDPDPDTWTVRELDDQEREAARGRLLDGLRELLEDANFQPVTEDDLAVAFTEESLLPLHLEVDRSDFADVVFFRRGETVRREEQRRWFGLRRRTVTFTNYEKVLVLVTFREAEHFADRDPEDLPFEPGSTILKLFQDVPRADLEMLFPNARPRMRRVDKLMIGVPALVSGIIVLTTKLVTTLGLLFLLVGFWLGLRDRPVELDQATLVTLGAGLGSLGGYLTRQVTKLKNRKLEFLTTLADSLYFRNLDNDVGVLHHLVDAAEEEEVKEALLGWWFLQGADGPRTLAELDADVERWFADRWDLRVDYEVDDGVAKLRDLGLVEQDHRGRLSAVSVDEAMRRLDARWDAYFRYHHPADGAP
jgi:hypothetical protein